MAPPSASTRRRRWRRCKPTAPRRTSSSPARHLTPAPPTVPPVPPKALRTLNFTTCTHAWRTHRGDPLPPHHHLELVPMNSCYISTCHSHQRPPTIRKRRHTVTSQGWRGSHLNISDITLLERRKVRFFFFFFLFFLNDHLIWLNGFSWRGHY